MKLVPAPHHGGIVDAGLLETGHLKGQVTSVPIRRKD